MDPEERTFFLTQKSVTPGWTYSFIGFTIASVPSSEQNHLLRTPTLRTEMHTEVQPLTSERESRLRRVGQTIRHARGSMTQVELGEALAEITGEIVPQTTISRWEKGVVSLDLEQLRAIELALDLPPGVLFASTGYVPVMTKDPNEVEDWLLMDPNLDDTVRESAVLSYRSWVKMSRQLRNGQQRTR